MSFDPLARLYEGIEALTFGAALWHTRMRYLDEMGGKAAALVLGDGDGRFTAALARSATGITIVSLDSSTAMLQAARRRLSIAEQARVYFVCGDFREIPLRWEAVTLCGAVVSHFVLDCLEQSEMDALARTIAKGTRRGCVWLISEFAIPEEQPWRWGGRWLIAVLYWFTGKITGLKVKRLPDYTASLRQAGFERKLLDRRWKGLLRSEVWERVG